MPRALILSLAISVVAWLAPAGHAAAPYAVEYEAGFISNVSSSDFAPYFIGSGRHGLTASKSDVLMKAGIHKPLESTGRWGFGFGISLTSGYTSSSLYERYDDVDEMWDYHKLAPASAFTLRELYAEGRYRSLVVRAGMKNTGSALYNDMLSSGDFVHSANARPVPQLNIGLTGFRPVPLTSGWLEVDAAWAIGRFTDDSFIRSQFNYYSYHINTGSFYHYKRALFRTKPSEPFSVTFGMQSAGQFGGTCHNYYQGTLTESVPLSRSFRTLLEVSLPFMGQGGEGFYTGNTLGSWDFKARYRFESGHKVYAYFQWPWEDGSGIAKRNATDGIWGLEWEAPSENYPVNGAVVEYIDFRHQGGPIHWAPGDHPGTTVTSSATGRDDYYNNALYNSYAHYGLSLGTPFLVSPLYNTDGYPAFAHNKARGFHAAVSGNPFPRWSYVLKFSWQQAWGNGKIPQARALYSRSWLMECAYDIASVKFGAALAVDQGNLRGNNFGALISVKYTGSFSFGKP